MAAITPASAIYYDSVNKNVHWGIEANFTGGGWALQIEEIERTMPETFTELRFDASTYVLFNRDKRSRWSTSESRGTMLVLIHVGGFQVRRHIFQSKGMMTPVVIPSFYYQFASPQDNLKVVLHYQGEVGCNFEMHMTAAA